MPSGPPLVFIFSFLIIRCTSNGLKVMLFNWLSALNVVVGGIVPSSDVNLLEKTFWNNSAFVDEKAAKGVILHPRQPRVIEFASKLNGKVNGKGCSFAALERKRTGARVLSYMLKCASSSCCYRNKALVRDTIEFSKDFVDCMRASPLRRPMRTFVWCKQNSDSISATSLWLPCPTRWTVHVRSMQSVIDNCEALMQVGDEVSQSFSDESSATSDGFFEQLECFDSLTLTLN